MSKNKRAARLGSGGGDMRTNQRGNNNTRMRGGARARKPLTPEQRGRFWQSVGDAIEAARAGIGGAP